MDGARIAQLLAHGAHALGAPDEEAAKDGDAFTNEVRGFSVPRKLPGVSLVSLQKAEGLLMLRERRLHIK